MVDGVLKPDAFEKAEKCLRESESARVSAQERVQRCHHCLVLEAV